MDNYIYHPKTLFKSPEIQPKCNRRTRASNEVLRHYVVKSVRYRTKLENCELGVADTQSYKFTDMLMTAAFPLDLKTLLIDTKAAKEIGSIYAEK